jgi:hypothetical protein
MDKKDIERCLHYRKELLEIVKDYVEVVGYYDVYDCEYIDTVEIDVEGVSFSGTLSPRCGCCTNYINVDMPFLFVTDREEWQRQYDEKKRKKEEARIEQERLELEQKEQMIEDMDKSEFKRLLKKYDVTAVISETEKGRDVLHRVFGPCHMEIDGEITHK